MVRAVRVVVVVAAFAFVGVAGASSAAAFTSVQGPNVALLAGTLAAPNLPAAAVTVTAAEAAATPVAGFAVAGLSLALGGLLPFDLSGPDAVTPVQSGPISADISWDGGSTWSWTVTGPYTKEFTTAYMVKDGASADPLPELWELWITTQATSSNYALGFEGYALSNGVPLEWCASYTPGPAVDAAVPAACVGLSGPSFWGMFGSTNKYFSGLVPESVSSSIVSGLESPGGFPSGLLQQTIECQQPDGTIYVKTVTETVTAGQLSAAGSGVGCDPGDFAVGASVGLETDSGLTDLSGSPTFVPGYGLIPDPVKNELVTDGGTVSAPGDGTLVVDIPTPQDPGDCAVGWGDLLNGSVIVDAVSCSLYAVFVPSDGFMEAAQVELESSFDGSPVGLFLAQISAPFDSMISVFSGASDGSCGVLKFPLEGVGPFQQDIIILDPCADYMSGPVTIVRLVLVFGLVVAAVPMIANPILASLGLPKISYRGSGSGDDS